MLLHTVQTLAFLIHHTVRSYVSTIVGLHNKKKQQQQHLRNANINLSLLFEPHNYAIQGIGINILRKFGPLLVDAITGMKFLCMYLYKKAYTAPVLVCLVSTSWLLPSLLFSLKKYNMTQLQGLLVCLDQPLPSLSIYYLYYNPFLFILCLTLASFSFIMLLLWYDECCCLCVFAFSLIRKGEMLPQHWKFHSKSAVIFWWPFIPRDYLLLWASFTTLKLAYPANYWASYLPHFGWMSRKGAKSFDPHLLFLLF